MIRQEPSYFPIFCLGALSGAMAVIVSLIKIRISPSNLSDITMQYNDLAAVLLAATSTIVTVLGVFIAVLAIWGYSQFEKMTKAASTSHLEKLLESGKYRDEIDQTILNHVSTELAKDESPFRDLLRQQLDSLIYTDAAKRQKDEPQGSGETPFKD